MGLKPRPMRVRPYGPGHGILMTIMENHGFSWNYHDAQTPPARACPYFFMGFPWGCHGLLWLPMASHGFPWLVMTFHGSHSSHGAQTPPGRVRHPMGSHGPQSPPPPPPRSRYSHRIFMGSHGLVMGQKKAMAPDGAMACHGSRWVRHHRTMTDLWVFPLS